MFKYRDNLYISPSIKNVNKVKLKLRLGRGMFSVYLIVFNDESGKLEYFHNSLLKQTILYKREYDVVGLATNVDECIDIIKNILESSYNLYGEYNINKYLNNK